MRLPSHIYIQNKVWEVASIPNYLKKESLYGMCHPDENLIEIASDQSEESKRITLLHEILHALWPTRKRVKRHTEENLIGYLDTKLYKVLLTNPDLIQYLTQMRLTTRHGQTRTNTRRNSKSRNRRTQRVRVRTTRKGK